MDAVVLGPDDPNRPVIGLKIYENIGSPVYLVPEGFVPAEHTREEAESLMTPAHVIRDIEGIKIGTWLFLDTLWGGIVMVQVTKGDGDSFLANSEDGNTGYSFYYVRNHYLLGFGDEQQALWICGGRGNLKGLRKLQITR